MKYLSKLSRIKWPLLLVLILGILFIISEFIFYFPLTYLSLDIDQKTKLQPKKSDLTILFTGDIMMGKFAKPSLESYGYDYPFLKTSHIIKKADFAIGNLEGPITEQCNKIPGKKWSYKVSPKATSGLKAGGFDAMTLANNHIRDCKDVGIVQSIKNLKKQGISPFGGGLTPKSARKPLIITKKGVKIAFFSYLAPYIYLKGRRFSYLPYSATKSHGGGAYGTARNVKEDIKKIRKSVDLIVVIYHVGDRYIKKLRKDHVKQIKKVLDFGADAVICHGTHIAGPIGNYKGKPIFYGIGNFSFGSINPFATFSLMAILYINSVSKKIYKIRAIPIYTNNLNPIINFRPLILKGFMARKFLTSLISRSNEFKANPIRKGNSIYSYFK